MARTTIDYGIDLGTTNSAIALADGVEARVIPNREGAAFTPSAVWLDRKNRMHVGRLAKERAESHPDECAIEFKLRMGEGERAARALRYAEQPLTPEALSAEVLKQLREDARQNTGDDIGAAVITVPAAFELPQCEATRVAGELAGLTETPLLQEPVAAALAYGFQEERDNVLWLIYDFGGGTFDAAVIQVREGRIEVVNHAGDNNLGGKLIDWDIVTKRLAPQLATSYALPDFHRGNPRWRTAFAKLKQEAEKAKIEISRTEQPFELWIENVCEDEGGATVELEVTLGPADLEAIVKPYATRSINLCRQALSERSLAPRDLDRVVAVGGTSLLPWLRHAVQQELGKEVDFSFDPITIVARGAAIFAGGQRQERRQAAPAVAGVCQIELEYDSQGADIEPPIGGRVAAPDSASVAGYSLQFVDARTQWRSGKVTLGANGVFMTSLHAERGRRCEYEIELYDATGGRVPCDPERITYTNGLVVEEVPLIHSLGVAMANNEMDVFLRKGTPLPARHRSVHQTITDVRSGQDGNLISIPIVEGENARRADRNRRVGVLSIAGSDVRRDVPAGSEIEITLNIDPSRNVTSYAYIPVLDQEFEKPLKLEKTVSSVDHLTEELAMQRRRLDEVRETARELVDPKVAELLERIDREAMLSQVEELLAAAGRDDESLSPCENRMLDLKAAIDAVEDAAEWPALVKKAGRTLNETDEMLEQYGEPGDRERFERRKREIRDGIHTHDADQLRRRIDDLLSFGFTVLERRPEWWVHWLQQLEPDRHKMRDPNLAEQLLVQGRRAIESNDVEALQAAVRQLIRQLPLEEQAKVRGWGGSTIRTF
jgi:molecular chaperone DnaK